MHWKLETKIISNKLIIMPYDFCRDLRYLVSLQYNLNCFFHIWIVTNGFIWFWANIIIANYLTIVVSNFPNTSYIKTPLKSVNSKWEAQ